MDRPIAWYDPSNGVVSTDKDSPLFTPLGQVWALYPEPKQEPVASYLPEMSRVAWGAPDHIDLRNGWRPLYTTPPQRPWVGLTDEDWEPLYDKFAKHQEYGAFVSGWDNFARAIEAKLKEKNNG